MRFLVETGDPAAKTQAAKSPMTVDDILLKRGYIRVQVYENGGLGLQGKPEAVQSYGHAALAIQPNPKRVYVMEWPSGETSLYNADELKEIGLGKA